MTAAQSKEILAVALLRIEELPVDLREQFKSWHDRLQSRAMRAQPIDKSLARLIKELEQQTSQLKFRKDKRPQVMLNQQLPIYEWQQKLVDLIQKEPVVIVAGETGSGKTTQLPQICLQAGRGSYGLIGHTQPRRIAARSVAGRIAEELNTSLGDKVGFQVRFDKQVSENSFIKVMTDGVLLNELHHDPLLLQYDTLIIDEAHERSLNIDFILGIVKNILSQRQDLRLIITSATIDLDKFSVHFDDAPIVEVSGRTYPVEMRYRTEDDYQGTESFDDLVLAAVRELGREGPGDTLIFLPTEQVIRHLADHLRRHLRDKVEIIPLYARLAQQQQMKIFTRQNRPRIVLSTNIAETSLTVPGISYVIDSGLARISRYSTRSKIQRLPIEAISQASANQRAGRCGRTHEGICIRLYSETDFQQRPVFTDPEILRTNLAMVILQMAHLDLGAIERFDFIDPPEQKQINDGVQLLRELGAMDEERQITPLGRQLARLAVDPRIGRILIAGAEQGAMKEVTIIAAAIGIQDPRERPLEFQQKADEFHQRFKDKRSDFVSLLKLWEYFHDMVEESSWSQIRKRCQAEFIHFQRMREWREQVGQLHRLMKQLNYDYNSQEADYDAIHKSILSGFLTQVGQSDPRGYYLAPRQIKLYLFPGSGLYRKQKIVKKTDQSAENQKAAEKQKAPSWIMAAELVETSKNFARLAAEINPDWLEALAGPLIKRQYSEPFWSKKGARAMVRESGLLYGLPIYSGRNKPLANFDALAARRWFIDSGIIERELKTRCKVLINNWNILDEAVQLQERSRKMGQIVDRDWLWQFYDRQLPASIHNGAAFERWCQKLGKQHRTEFRLSLEQVCELDPDQAEQEFPARIVIKGIPLTVEYHFKPTSGLDGMHIYVPLLTLGQFETTDFQWLVPGLLDELIITLLRGLPKPLRKSFVPVPVYAAALQQRLVKEAAPLYEQMASGLKQMTGSLIDAADFAAVELPDNLTPLFKILDQKQRLVGQGRDLDTLKDKHGAALASSIQTETARLTSFPDKPFEALESIRQGEAVVTVYQGLQKAGQGFLLVKSDDQEQSRRWHLQALIALLTREQGKLLRDMKDHLPELNKGSITYSRLTDSAVDVPANLPDTLFEDILALCITQQFQHIQQCHDPDSFELLKQNVRRAAIPLAVELASSINQTLALAADLRRRIDKPDDLRLLQVASQIRDRHDELLFRGFIQTMGETLLRQFPRYLKGLALRLESALEKPQQERQNSISWDNYWQQYAALPAKHRTIELRQMMEEFHIMLFAQQLGTKMKVSGKRLDKRFKETAG